MEWREQTSVSCMDAFEEAKRWIEKVTSKSFESSNFRAALENGVLLCDLMNKLKPGIIKRLNRLSTPIAGLDNVNVFLKACSKLGLNESQLFHPGDLQDLSTRVTLRSEESNRRLKNVLITVYWLGRRAQLEPFYCGPQLNFKAFEGLLGLTLSKALEEGSGLCPRDGGYGDPEKENLYHVRPAYRRDDSVEGGNYLDHRSAHQRSEGCGSDVEADQLFSMSAQKDSAQQQERGYVPPVEGAYPLPREGGCVAPAPLRRKKGCEENKQGLLTSNQAVLEQLFLRWPCEEVQEDSSEEENEADPLLDDLYTRRLHQHLHQTSSRRHHDQFLPQFWTPEEEVRVKRILRGSEKRTWYRRMLAGMRMGQRAVRL